MTKSGWGETNLVGNVAKFLAMVLLQNKVPVSNLGPGP
jgi:hypothetical protein